MASKTTRAFRTISEAGDELGLQPHVLRFWESKFPQINPIKRGGGRRFYRPEDIEFLRGIKILLHDEKHPIKDVQKLIRVKGPGSVIELGRSKEKASRPKDVKDTVLIPDRIQQVPDTDISYESIEPETDFEVKPVEPTVVENPEPEVEEDLIDVSKLENALERLLALRDQWEKFS